MLKKEENVRDIEEMKRDFNIQPMLFENTRLKKLVADLTLDKDILKEAASKNF